MTVATPLEWSQRGGPDGPAASDPGRQPSPATCCSWMSSTSGEGARTWVVNERDWSSVVDIVDATYRVVLGTDD